MSFHQININEPRHFEWQRQRVNECCYWCRCRCQFYDMYRARTRDREGARHEKSGREPMSDTVNLDLTAWLLEFLGFLRGFTVATSRLVGFIVNNNFVCSNLGFFPAPYVHWRVLWSRTTTLCHFWFCQTVFFFALSLSFFSQSLFHWSKLVPVFFFYQNWKQATSSWRTAFLSHSSVCVQGFPLQNNLLVLI